MDFSNTRRKSILVSLMLVLLASSFTACNGGAPGQVQTVISEPAHIETVTLIALGQTPVKIHASIKGTYPNDCTLVYDIQQSWEDEVYGIRIMTKRPVADEHCGAGPIEFEEIYEIPVYRLEAGEYLVDVNGVQEPLVFVFDNE